MNGLDLVLVLLACTAAVGGWRLGFLTRALGWVGAGLGLVLAVAVVPVLLRRVELSSDLAIFLLGALCFVLIASLGQGIGMAIGSRLRPPVRSPAAHRVDALGGSLLGIVGVAVLAWLVLPVMADTRGWAASTARNSTLARWMIEHLPEPPPQIAELERRLAGGDFPDLFAGVQPAPEVPDPPADSPIGADALAALAGSTARVEGEACGLLQSGSAFMAAPGVMVTNAHVVAGTREITLVTPDGERAPGRVVDFDARTDLALVRTSLDRAVLPLARPEVGATGLVLGYPGGGPLDPSTFSVADVLDATGYDIYDRDLVRRDLLVLASDLAPGDSGSAVVRSDGSVVGVAVAIAPDRPGVAYALDTSLVTPMLGDVPTAEVATGDCLR